MLTQRRGTYLRRRLPVRAEVNLGVALVAFDRHFERFQPLQPILECVWVVLQSRIWPYGFLSDKR